MTERVSHFQNHLVSQSISHRISEDGAVEAHCLGFLMKRYRPLSVCIGHEPEVDIWSGRWTMVSPHGRWRTRDPGFSYFADDVAEAVTLVPANLVCGKCHEEGGHTPGTLIALSETTLDTGKPGLEFRALCIPCGYRTRGGAGSRTFDELRKRSWFPP